MAQKDEIQSTEKLLELIRKQNEKDAEAPVKSSLPPDEKITAQPAKRTLSFQKKLTIGVDIGHTYIKLAKVQRQADKTYHLLDYSEVPLSVAVSLKDEQFRKILKENLDRFCAGSSNYEIWSAIASANVEIRCLRIPKLPAKQIPNAVYWTFTKKVTYNPTSEILDYEILGDVAEGGVSKTEILAFKAPRADVEDMRAAFERIGYPLKGISIVPFGIQNLFRAGILPSQDSNVCCLFIGRDWSRIAIYNNGNLMLSRGIKAGMHSMVEAINIGLFRPDGWGPNAHQQDHEATLSRIDPLAQKAFFEFIRDDTPSVVSLSETKQVSAHEIFQLMLPAMERLIRQIERTFEHYALNFHREGIGRILISGQITSNAMVVGHIGQQLDTSITIMDPFASQTFSTEKVKIPQKPAQRESYVPAIGMALSTNRQTPNFLFTHRQKEELEQVRKNNMRVLTFCMLCLIVLIGIFSWQERRLDLKRSEIDKLSTRLMAYTPPAEKEVLLALYAKTKDKRQAMGEVAHRYTPMALIHEIAAITPASVRLLRVDGVFPASKDETATTVIIEGLIFSEAKDFETMLTSYLFSLKNSPLFDRPSVSSKRIEYYNNQEVLRFSTRLELI